MRFYKIINNVTKEVFLTAQIDETTLCGINYKNKPLSNIEELLNLATDNFTDLDSIALPLLNPDNLKIDLEEAYKKGIEHLPLDLKKYIKSNTYDIVNLKYQQIYLEKGNQTCSLQE